MMPTGGGGRKKIAIIATNWEYLSRAQRIGDCFLVGYPRDGRWYRPPIEVVAVYVDQRPDGDQSRLRAEEFGFTVYPTIPAALRRGGDRMAVDAVIICAEHGNYPRPEFFRQVIKVFEEDGRAVPVFNDGRLSHSFEKARQMVATSRRLGFPLMAGSSFPVTWRLPSLELPLGSPVSEALTVGVGSSDSSDYQALEAMQCMVERRKGGETGVRSVQMLEGEAAWKAGDEGRWSKELLGAALSRSFSLQGLTLADGRPQELVNSGEVRRLVKSPSAYLIEYADGLRTAMLMLNGAVGDFTFAARIRGGHIVSTQFLLTPQPNAADSACLAAKIEELLETGRTPYPVERTLLAGGIVERCLESRLRNQRLDTLDLRVRYQAPRTSQFCR